MAQRTNTVKVSAGGRIVIPAAFRKELGFKPDDDLLIELEDGCLRLRTRAQGLKRAQEIVGK
ncbi:MAG: AbrB/MazE/SpoVT family DNA-binding domain-containing protein [Tepidiformaceae bacterium]